MEVSLGLKRACKLAEHQLPSDELSGQERNRSRTMTHVSPVLGAMSLAWLVRSTFKLIDCCKNVCVPCTQYLRCTPWTTFLAQCPSPQLSADTREHDVTCGIQLVHPRFRPSLAYCINMVRPFLKETSNGYRFWGKARYCLRAS